jgi:leucine dehydrogenase
VNTLASQLDAETVSPGALLERSLDVLAPCARGGILTHLSAGSLAAEIVCGAANNILASDDVAELLQARGVVYVPDFLANAGGIIHVGGAFLEWSDGAICENLEAAIGRVGEVLDEARDRGVPPLTVGYERAAERLAQTRAPAQPA